MKPYLIISNQLILFKMKKWRLNLIPGRAILSVLIAMLFMACQNNEKKETDNQDDLVSEGETKHAEESKTKVVDILTNAMEFKTKDELKSGWHTFRYKNQSNETHFVLFERYPEGKGVKDATAEVIPVFQEGMDLINQGKGEEAGAAFGKLPEWFQQVKFVGGVGLTSPKTTTESTIYLEPGTYFIECYVKMANGVFHSAQGMYKEIKVTEADSAKADLIADYKISISSSEGIIFEEKVSAGKKIFKVEFGEQKIHENYLMHDVHLVWVDQGADLSALNSWMNWADPKGLQTPAPQGFKFLGGMQEIETGRTGYFTANLRPGNYALIAEVPDPQSKNMLKTFTVK
jgi:hypothetical protein